MMSAILLPPIGRRVRRLRERAGFTQEQLATAARCSTDYVHKIERRKTSNVGLETLAQIAAALNVSLAMLVRQRRSFLKVKMSQNGGVR